MKKIYYLHATFITLLICTLFSCVDDNFFSTTTQQKFNEFSLEEAKTYFKKKAERQLSRSTDIDKNIPLYPGDFTPMWDAAVLSTKNGLACYDIPINETNSYQALFSEEHHGTMNVGKVKVYQKLVILKDVKGDRMSQYILSLIPAKSYASQKGEQIPNLFITRGDKGAFSGIAVYSCLYTGITARVDTYEKGKMLKGVFLLDSKDEKELSKRIEIAQEQLNMLSLHKKRKLLSRGENGNGDDYEYNGGWLDEVIITPDEPWDGVGADGMTNEEWMESTRPDGNVDPQPEPEPEMPEEDYPGSEEEIKEDDIPNIIEGIFNKIELNTEQLDLLEKALIQIKSSDLGIKMYECLNENFKIDVKMNYDLKYDAIYDKNDKSVSFKEDSSINGDNLIEELIHAVQHYTYGDDMTSKNNNFEFEAKVLQDWDCIFNKEEGCGFRGEIGIEDDTWCKNYESLISTEQWNDETFDLYNELGKTWGQYEGIFDDNILPEVIMQYFEDRN